ncbi:tetratricopeptide repeat protein [Phenylobacterium sp.]|uniref:tetratricopeptide repeat protein n=1 Tax=Phenylobacterium sp. TaxID=1871053 RepID=UPI0025E28113|nr:tetratricopeptide repeat protein [Phenylobacterium sp.]
MAFKRALRSGVAAACIVSVAAPAGLAAPAAKAVAARGGVDVRVATAETFSRIEVGKGGSLRREGSTVVLTVERDDDPDIGRLLTAPPPYIKSAVRLPVAGKPQIVITLADNADAKIGEADGATFANFFEKPATPTAPVEVPVAEPEPPRPNPLPAGGVVRMASKAAGGQIQFSFAWANPAGAAVFRRGDAIWVVFDAPATLDVSSAPKNMRPLRGMQAFKGADHAALRIDADPDAPVFVASQGSTWTISLGPGSQSQPAIVRVGRDAAGGPATLKAPVAGATRVINLWDPVVGDTLSVVTALGPPKGVPSRRDYVDAALLPSIQGLAIEPLADNVTVQRDGELVRISRAETGLTLSPPWATRDREDAQLGAPRPASMPGIVMAEWAQVGSLGFLRRYDSLVAAASNEGGNKDREAPVAARMALVRFLVGSELSYEAIGALNALAREHPEMLDDPEFRGLRGVARTLARRYAEADADFSSPALADDPSTALWRAYVNTQIAQYPEARAQFAKGIEAYGLMSPLWKARFARADAQAALAQGDLVAAESRIDMALQEKVPADEQLRARLIQARVIELKGFQDRALRIYKAIGTAPIDSIATPAVLRATQIRLQLGQINTAQAASVYDGLRYRWRGDSTELETIRALGQLYLGQGRYREALEALRSAGVRLPDLPEAQQLQADLNAAFRGLFLDGLADGLEPLQALALFFDFKELAPIGADGDLMVRKIVRRLVDVDLLPQAAELLKYQAENRLDGVPKAQVATDLAVIYLMDRKPEQALEAINGSRTTVLPAALNAERRLVEARAWTALGRYDSALEILGNDASKDGQDLRAEITWKQKNWAAAGPLFEKSLGERWKDPTQLSSDEEGRLLRAGVAYSLAGDDAALGRLQSRYQGFYEKANNPDALRIALSGEPSGRLTIGDFGRVSADNEAFAGWVEKMKGRFKTRAAPTGSATAKPVAPAKQAQATPARAAAKG